MRQSKTWDFAALAFPLRPGAAACNVQDFVLAWAIRVAGDVTA